MANIKVIIPIKMALMRFLLLHQVRSSEKCGGGLRGLDSLILNYFNKKGPPEKFSAAAAAVLCAIGLI
ncbi:hypothetical protein [Pontibacter beigongshangensis]|uniref:hypothetical protein n=1 Tax=Pontibacter beigongshangensis TaxID=2574733 RepID=UPI00164EF4D2|nr:hypothetical protein [Pontibacter beigongshangensis]